ncbi:TolC family protein [Pontiellaceae bacterium B1224]|nr:TolC family protein [Pontiellaceae bacterium B1224]
MTGRIFAQCWMSIFMASAVGAATNSALVEVSLEEAVMLGLKNNRGLRVQQYEPVIAGAYESIERGIFDPELFAEAAYGKENATEVSRSTIDQFQVEGSETEGTVGVRQFLATGTEIEAAVSTEYSESNRSPEQQQARVGLTVTQQLLRGLGPSVNLAGVRQAEIDTEASQFELRGYTEALIADIETTYWQYVAAREAINVFEKSLEIARTQLEEVEARIEVGDLPSNEAAAANAEVALRNQNLIDARSLLTEQRYTLMRLVKPDWLATPADSFKAISRPTVDAVIETDVNASINLALLSRPEIREAELRVRRGKLETVVTRNGRLPKLELFINLGKTGYADAFKESFEDLDGPGYDATVGIGFSQALGNRTARGRDLIARTEVLKSEEALANLRDLVRFDVLLALNELDRARLQISATSQTRVYREQTLQAEQDRFEVGTSTALDVALTQRDLVDSQIAEIRARVAYLNARVRLYLAEGSLLERRGLSVAR